MTSRPGLVLHIGEHKTGSTDIQRYLDKHTEPLARIGYSYPQAGSVGWQHAVLPAAYMTNHPFLRPDLLNQDPQPIADAIAADVTEGLTPILSSEVFWELLMFATDDFDAAVGLLAARFNVTMVYFVRPAADKSWSSVKHMARAGQAFDASVVLASDLRRNEAALAHLQEHYPEAVRVDYSGEDSITAFLETLRTAQKVGHDRKSPVERLRLRNTIKYRRKEAQSAGRLNTDSSHPAATAVTLEVARALLAAPPLTRDEHIRLEVFHKTVFADGQASSELAGLPSAGEMHRRVTAAEGEEGSLLTDQERAAVAAFLRRPEVAAVAEQEGLAALVVLAADDVDGTASTSAQP